MSNTKHTPGPWLYINDSPYHRVDCPDGRIYVASSEAGSTEEIEQANAKLIAAAPELLEAIMVVKNKIANLPSNKEWTDLWQGTWERLNEAVKKATE